MDTQFQNLGESSNPSNDFQAGEFATLPPVSPVVLQGAASFGSLVRITEDYRPEQVGEFGVITSEIAFDVYEVSFSAGSDYYSTKDFELVRPSSNPSKELQPQLVEHLNALLSAPVDAVNVPALIFLSGKLHKFISLDADGAKRSDIDSESLKACDFLRFGYEDLTNGSKFGRRVAAVFIDSALEHLKQAAAFLAPQSKKAGA